MNTDSLWTSVLAVNQIMLPSSDFIALEQYHPDFESIAGEGTLYSLLLSSADSSNNPFFHNTCAYVPQRDELYATSDLLQSTSSSRLPVVLISKVSLRRSSDAENSIHSVEWMKLRPPSSMPMPSGATHYKDGVLYCSQGTLAPESGGLWYMPSGKPPTPIVTSYFGRPFNSIQGVTLDKDNGLWFTDACIGFEQDIRPKPQLPSHVYRFDPETGDLRVVADGFRRPTGIAVSPDRSTLYVTDTDAALPNGNIDPTRAATIYAFDVIWRFDSPSLVNRRVFAYARKGVPTAVVCDASGNVYAACADGVEIWSPGGVALGLIALLGGCSSLCFGRNDEELFIGAKQRLWKIHLKPKPESSVEMD
ncbi:hypothetical protein AAE478_000507 [Parahypoxylon ruwenzoriense]